MVNTLEELLRVQAIATGFILLFFGLILKRKNLFNWTTAGFWAWAAFALYFVVNPLASSWWNLQRYAIRLSLSGGLARGEWIMVCSLAGMIVFFLAYFMTKTRPYTWNLDVTRPDLTVPMKLAVVGILALAGLSLLTFRTKYFSTSQSFVIEGGEFTGEVTGYEYMGHVFAFVPIAILLLSPRPAARGLGWLLSIVYVVFSLPEGWARFTLVSMVITMALAGIVRQNRTWPRPLLIGAILLLGMVLQIQGHHGLESSTEFYERVGEIPDEVGSVLAAGDTAMLASWYLQSYVKDTITGYDYGIPFVNYILFGVFPGRYFPQKYFLLDWLRSTQHPVYDAQILSLLYGSKTSLFGSFYNNGGLIAVMIGAWLAGVISRKIDGMLLPESAMLVQATGVTWLSMLWIIWGSNETWGLIRFGTMLLPALVIWAVAPKQSVKSRKFPWGSSPTLPHRRQTVRHTPYANR